MGSLSDLERSMGRGRKPGENQSSRRFNYDRPLPKPKPREQEPHWLVLGDRMSSELAPLVNKVWRPVSILPVIAGAMVLMSVLFIRFRDWISIVFEGHICPGVVEQLVPATTFASTLPDFIAVWFEETTTVIDPLGCRRYNAPYCRFGNTIIGTSAALSWT